EKIDSRSDIFSLGVLLYQMLTGKNPFAADSIHTAIYKILKENPRTFSELNLEVSPELERVVFKAMAKERDERFGTAEEMKIGLMKAKKIKTIEKKISPDIEIEGDKAKDVGKLQKENKAEKKNFLPYLIIFVGIIIAFIVLLLIFRPVFKLLRNIPQKESPINSEEKKPLTSKENSLIEDKQEKKIENDEITEEESKQFGKLNARIPYEISSSSELSAGDGSFYGVRNLIDEDKNTSWAEGVPGFGKNEWIKINFKDKGKIAAIGIIPGKLGDSQDGIDEWYANGRVRVVEVELSTGNKYKFTFRDEKRFQTRRIFPPVDVSNGWVKIILKEFYFPVELTNQRKDTFLSELTLLGKLE
ncbi:MAG: hypothetical protein KAS39_03975, partial [Actinomycetia bacterium]|nr:hypothetical protein [Actinomycetes bacterium]